MTKKIQKKELDAPRPLRVMIEGGLDGRRYGAARNFFGETQSNLEHAPLHRPMHTRHAIMTGLFLSTAMSITPARAGEYEEEMVCMSPETYGTMEIAAVGTTYSQHGEIAFAEDTWLLNCLEYGYWQGFGEVEQWVSDPSLQDCLYWRHYEDCMENGYMTIDGDIAQWHPPTQEDCEWQAEIGWWTGETLSESCRSMGEAKRAQCMEQFDPPETSSEHLEQENYCDSAATTCGRGCMLGDTSGC